MSETEKNVLIAGGSGLIGSRLTQMLLEKDYQVAWLSRSKTVKSSFPVYHWDPEKDSIEQAALEQAGHIINLAGFSLNGPWNNIRKAKIISSRVNSADLLFRQLQKIPHQVKSYISASGINYYGDGQSEWLDETFPPANDFLGYCCQKWEKAAGQMKKLGIRSCYIRTGLVLSAAGGALPKLAAPVRWGLGAALGNGAQWVSWIHLDDLCRMYVHLLEHPQLEGPYNGAAPFPVSNRELTATLATVLKKPYWLPAIPAFLLRIALGERSALVLNSTRANVQRILDAGFEFDYPRLSEALNEFYN